MSASADSAQRVELQPTMANHVSRQEILALGTPRRAPERQDPGQLLRPTLVVLAALCGVAIVALLVVNWRLAAVDNNTGSPSRVESARDFFDLWIRPTLIIGAVAATVLTAVWIRRDPSRLEPEPRRLAVLAGLGGSAVCAVVGAVVGADTIAAARAANVWAMASYGLLAASSTALWVEIGPPDRSSVDDRDDMAAMADPGYLPVP